jgi:hypothetical protein
MPEDYQETYWRLKDTDRTRGKKSHWVQSAYAMGFRNVDDNRSGILYCPELAVSGSDSTDHGDDDEMNDEGTIGDSLSDDDETVDYI